MGPQEDYIETVFTCEGDFDDPHLQDRLDDFQSSLKDLLLTDKNKLILKKVEPWNSVRVTFNIPREAAARLKQLAQQGNATLRDLGVLAVTILDQHISLTIAGRNNERTHLVFKTADTPTGSSVSMFDSQSPALDVLRPPGPGPSNVEATRKNIQDYLKGSLIDSLFGRGEGEKARHPGELNSRPNNIFPGHLGDPFHSRNPATTSPSTSCHSPSRSPGVASGPAMPLGLPPGLPFGPGNSLAGLPPPPPYPQGSSYMNNLQKLRFGSTSTSPLLVNLLQNDPGLSSLLASGKIPPLDPDALQPPKKKRKPRKPREKKPKPGSEGEIPVKNVPNPVLSSSTTSQYSTTSAMYTQSVRDHNSLLQHSQAMHNTSVQNVCDDRVPLTSEQPSVKKLDAEAESSAGKIINPVTGLLEPIENLSDTSPEKASPKSIAGRPPSGKAGDIISNLITTHIKSDNQETNLGNQRTHSVELSASHKVAVGRVSQWSEKSSQLSVSASSDNTIEQKREAIRQEFINMIHKEKSKDVRKTEKLGQHNLPLKVREHSALLDGKQAVSSLGTVAQAPPPREEKVSSLPQERDVKSIPSQLLNKPLLEVKHNSVTNPTGSPDSNGDSECSSQGIGIEPHLGQEPSAVSAVTSIDPHLKSYNNDSGVGSSSERSEDPSEPGDNDYKGTQSNNNSFECAKSQLLDPSKQPPTSSNAMTVAHATMTDIVQKDLKNHKILSPFFNSETLVNSKIDPLNPKLEHLMNDRTFHKGVKDHMHVLNSVEPNKTQLVGDSVNRKSPKLVASSPKLAGQEAQIKTQGNPENPPTQKKKYSPRNSPRGSPRPRANSPRNSGSPRASDFPPGSVGTRMPFFTAQDFSAHLPVRSESHLGLQRNEQVRSPYNEQRKSPFAVSQNPPYSHPPIPRAHHPGVVGGVDIENRRDLSHSGGSVDVARLSAQCNIDNVAMLKSLEAYHNPHTQLHLSALAGTKDPVALQRKLEEFRPIFQQLQQQAAQAHLIVPPATNGTDQQHSPSRSPVTASSDVHGVPDIAAQRGNSHPGVGSISSAAVSTESSGNCVSNRLSKTVDEQKGTNSASGVRRSSPGVANTVPFPYASSLPLPKRLTESVQKLVKPLPLDNSLPHQTSRSPSSSASTVKQGHSGHNSSGKASARTSTSGHKSPAVNDASHLDIDSITPSITGFCFDGPLDLGHSLPQITSPTLREELGPPSLQLSDSSLSAGAILGSAPHASTKLVPAVTSTILSHKTYSSDTPLASNSAFVSCRTLPGGVALPNQATVSTAISCANVSTTVSVCNSDVKMANLSAKEQTSTTKPGLNSSGLGPPILQPYNARHPLLKHEEKPKSPYQQMDLSEMLQETANLQSLTAEKLPAHISVSQRTTTNSQLNVNSALNPEHDRPVSEHSELPIPPVLSRQNSGTLESKPSNCDSSIETVTSVKVADSKAVAAVETSQSKSDLPPSGNVNKDCDKKNNVERECDKVNVVPVSKTEIGTSISLSSAAAANPIVSSLLLGSTVKEKARSNVSEINENVENSKSTKVRDRSQTSVEEPHEETADSSEVDSAPRQLRSRKRTNTGESDGSLEEPTKKAKLDTSSLTSLNSSESKQSDDSNTQSLIDTVKSGLRARTNVKPDEKEKDKEKIKTVPGKESKKDIKMAAKSVPERRPEMAKPEEILRRNSQSRRSRQSPSTILEKPQNAAGVRDKSPVRSRTRGRNSPVVVEQHEEENKRTTRSAKTKVEPPAPEPATVNKRRRTSRDHR